MKDSLQFSNKSCEQLEQRAEELERNNQQLQKLCDIQQTLLDQKTSTLCDLQEDYSHLKYQHEQLQVKLAMEQSDTVSCEADQKLHTTNLKSDVVQLKDTGNNPEVVELQGTLAELTLKVQSSSFQKQKLERELEDVLNENKSLGNALERADSEIAELQMKLRHYEEESLDNVESTTLSPKSSGHSFTSASPHYIADDPQSPLNSHSSLKKCKSPKMSAPEQIDGLSLFGELDSQYSTLQQQYQELIKECTCSASLLHKEWLPSKIENPPSSVQENGIVVDTPFKELFEEVFATLKQTALVADKLIERKSSK